MRTEFSTRDVLADLEALETKKHYVEKLDRGDLLILAWWNTIAYNALLNAGVEYRGESFRQSEVACTMTVRAEVGGIQQVVFVTGRIPVDCMRSFFRLFTEDRLQWIADKYA